MKKRNANTQYLTRLFDPLSSLSDQEVDELTYIDLNQEPIAKMFFERNIVANFKAYGPKSQKVVKDTLSFLIYTRASKHTFEDVFPYGNIPIEEPGDVVLFLVWLWDSLFPDEKMEKFNESDFIVNNDYNAPNSVYIR